MILQRSSIHMERKRLPGTIVSSLKLAVQVFHPSEALTTIPKMISMYNIHLMSFVFTNVRLSQSPAKHGNRSLRIFIRPIIACSWQFVVLVMLVAFIIWTESTTYRVVPRHLATLFVEYPQGAIAATTLVGSLLSLISTKYVSGFQFQVVDY